MNTNETFFFFNFLGLKLGRHQKAYKMEKGAEVCSSDSKEGAVMEAPGMKNSGLHQLKYHSQ